MKENDWNFETKGEHVFVYFYIKRQYKILKIKYCPGEDTKNYLKAIKDEKIKNEKSDDFRFLYWKNFFLTC